MAKNMKRATFEDLKTTVNINGVKVSINGTIRSQQCTGFTTSKSKLHPHTCKACYSEKRHQAIKIKQRMSCVYRNENRYGKRGVRHDYMSNQEKADGAGHIVKNLREQLTKSKQSESSTSNTEEKLLTLCSNDEEEKFVQDICHLLKTRQFEKKMIHFQMLQNLAQKLRYGRGHKYSDLIIKVSRLYKNLIGGTGHQMLADIIGLASVTTVNRRRPLPKLTAGFNGAAFDRAIESYNQDDLINVSHDEARTLRMLSAFQHKNEIIYLGNGWTPDIHQWPDLESLHIPRCCEEKGDEDDWAAIQRLVDDIMPNLAKDTSIHNVNVVTNNIKQPIVIGAWPLPPQGYRYYHVLEIWQEIRRKAAMKNGLIREKCLKIVTYSSDSAPFSLKAGQRMMTPKEADIDDGILYLGLDTADERYAAPYYWHLPSIFIPDGDHLLRLFLRCLKYETLDMTFYSKKNRHALITIDHLYDLRNKCSYKDLGLSITDLKLMKYFDQNTNAAKKIFSKKVAELLDLHGANVNNKGTSLYIQAVYHLMKPYCTLELKNYEEVVQSCTTGIHIIRLWRKYIELSKLRLHSKPGAKKDASKKGNFLTGSCFESAELIYEGTIKYLLALYLHFKDKLTHWHNPVNSGTLTTERLISQAQCQTEHIQGSDNNPTFVDILNRLSAVQENEVALDAISIHGGKRPESNRRRALNNSLKQMSNEIEMSPPDIPSSFSEFKQKLICAIESGKTYATELVVKYLPPDFLDILHQAGCVQSPYSYDKPANMCYVQSTPPSYNLLHMNLANRELNTEEACDVSEVYDEDRDNRLDLELPVFESTDLASTEDILLDLPVEDRTVCNKWHVTKKTSNGLIPVHINQAFSLLIEREKISRDRSRRHIASKYLKGLISLNPGDDIIQFKDYALISNVTVQYIRVLQLRDSEGTRVVSCSSTSQCSFRGRPYKYYQQALVMEEEFILTRWTKVKSQDFIAIELDCDNDNLYHLDESSRKSLEDRKVDWLSGAVKTVQTKDAPEVAEQEPSGHIGDNYFVMDSIIGYRINGKSHTKEYKVRFKGYGPEDDEWVSASAFNQPVTFTTASSRGRKINTTITPDDISASTDVKLPTDCSLKTNAEYDIAHIRQENRGNFLHGNHYLKVQDISCIKNVTISGIEVRKPSLLMTMDGHWFDDDVLNAYMKILQDDSKGPGFRKMLTLPSYLIQLWDGGVYDNRRHLFKKEAFTMYEYVMMPFHVNNNHWLLLAAEVDKRLLYILDSMPAPDDDNRPITVLNHWVNFCKARGKWVKSDMSLLDDWTISTTKVSTRQTDGNNCGTFVAMNAEALIRGTPLEEVKSCLCKPYREHIVARLMSS